MTARLLFPFIPLSVDVVREKSSTPASFKAVVSLVGVTMPDGHFGRPQPSMCRVIIQFVTGTSVAGGIGFLESPSRQSRDVLCCSIAPRLPVLTNLPTGTTRSGRYIHKKPFGTWSSPQGSGTKLLAASGRRCRPAANCPNELPATSKQHR